MMMDMTWGVGVQSAPTMTGFGTAGSGFPDSIPDYDIEGFIDGLGFFEDKDGYVFDDKQPQYSLPPPIDRHDSSTTTSVVSVPELAVSTPCEVRSIQVALPQPPQLLTSSENNKNMLQSVLNQQRETILQNQKIIDAQNCELQGNNNNNNNNNNNIHQENQQPVAVVSSISPCNTPDRKVQPATYPLARAALKKADEQQIIDGIKIETGTKRKAASISDGMDMPTEPSSYHKWKLTPAGVTKLKAVDSSGAKFCRNQNHIKQQQEDVSGRNLSPDDLEVRRERNRKHAKKSRLRKKSLTSDLEHSLEVLREENTQLRTLIEEHFARKKAASDAEKKTVEGLLEKHRLRSHQRFIDCIMANSCSSKNTLDGTDAILEREVVDTKNLLSSSGRGIVVDDKTLKVLKGLSKAIASGTSKPKKQ